MTDIRCKIGWHKNKFFLLQRDNPPFNIIGEFAECERCGQFGFVHLPTGGTYRCKVNFQGLTRIDLDN